MKSVASALGLVAVLGFGATSHAQWVGLSHVWTVPGVRNTAGGLATYIGCTNGRSSITTIGVDIYGPTGSYVAGNSIPVGP